MGATVARCSSAHDKAALMQPGDLRARGRQGSRRSPCSPGAQSRWGVGGERKRAARPAYRQCETTLTVGDAIRLTVGDAISRRQAAVKPGPWPGRRAARRSALAGALVVPPQRTEPSAGYVHGRTFTWPHVVSVYLYLRRSETGLPLPEAPHASPTSTCAPALRAD